MRIIAGKFKGLKLNDFDLDNIRPTIDRVREGIFNKIQFLVNNADVLDVFGGTGAVSLEFVSRGSNVVTIDNNIKSLELIRQNFNKAKIKPNIMEGDYQMNLKKLVKSNARFDIVFLDPPFESDFGEKSLVYMKELLKDDGLVIYEHYVDKKYAVPGNLEVFDSKKYGTIVVDFLKRVCDGENC